MLKKIAQDTFEVKETFEEVGFSKEEAFQLTLAMFNFAFTDLTRNESNTCSCSCKECEDMDDLPEALQELAEALKKKGINFSINKVGPKGRW